MTTAKFSIVLLAGLIVLTGSATLKRSSSELKDKLIGIWKWNTVINSQTNEDMGIDVVTMGMATEVKTEFRKDNTYIESKLRKGSTEYSTTTGEWKIEKDEVLNLKPKDTWKPSKILKLSNDTLLLEMNPQMNLLMIKEK